MPSVVILPRPLVPRSLIKSRMRYIPGIEEQRSSLEWDSSVVLTSTYTDGISLYNSGITLIV